MSFLGFLPVLVLALNEPTFILIALVQAALVFFLCLASKSRAASVAIGVVGSILVSLLGSNRYAALDVALVLLAALVAIWKLTPYAAGETRGAVLAFAGRAAGGVVLLTVFVFGGLWLDNTRVQRLPTPAVNQAPAPGPVDDWVLAGSERGSQVYFNSSTLRTAKESIIVSVLLDFDEPNHVNGINYSSLVFEFITDCFSKRISSADPKYYSGKKGSGVIVFFEQVQSPYEVPPPGSPFLKLAKTSCDVLDYRNARK